MLALIGGDRRPARFRLMLVRLLLGRLQRRRGGEDQSAAEARGQPGQQPGAEARPGGSLGARLGELFAPELGVSLLGLGEPPEAAGELGAGVPPSAIAS